MLFRYQEVPEHKCSVVLCHCNARYHILSYVRLCRPSAQHTPEEKPAAHHNDYHRHTQEYNI